MIIPSFNEISKITDSRYALVMLVSKRARQLVDGSEPCINTKDENPVTTAIKEVMDNDVVFGEPMSDYEYRLKAEKIRLAEELEDAVVDVQADAIEAGGMNDIVG
ncbi:MAG: DNA-directed RNA polymerase subunit omega [Tissierellia bacterium]|nr:DNA-directed RNA polymerase subunit omega [Tissierellia bacterium]